jgi:hypothetical protein
MKKLYVILLGFFMMSNAFAGISDLFTYDANQVKNALVNAEVLDQMVSVNHLTLDQLNVNSPIMSNFKAESSSFMMQEDVLGIPAFWWGCVLGWVGILIVYLVTEDKEAAKKALWGCLVGTGVFVLFYFVLWGLIFTSAATSTAAAGY